MHRVVVREYARLTTAPLASESMDEAQVSPQAFDWLCRENARLSARGSSLLQVDNRQWLRLDSYVGVIETPCGTSIEILPKTTESAQHADASRALLQTMLARTLDLQSRETAPTHIHAFNGPLTEWVMRQFLSELRKLVSRGVRFGYHRVREQQRFLRGRLDTARQLRQPPGRQHLVCIEHDLFDANRAENRLLRSALDLVRLRAREPTNRRLALELAALLVEVPESRDIGTDFSQWQDDRLLAHYRPVRPWCSLILNQRDPRSTFGEWHGTSLLFPMEQVFERYVEARLKRVLAPGVKLKGQVAHEYLCSHRGADWFQLRPDILLRRRDGRLLIDSKWKLLDVGRSSAREKYNLKQSDFYQLFAYGQRYRGGCGDMLLVYPRSAAFPEALPVFGFSDKLRLWVVPFDLDRGELLLPPEVEALGFLRLPFDQVLDRPSQESGSRISASLRPG